MVRTTAVYESYLLIKLPFSLGDLHYKKFGVTPEPEVRTKVLESQYLRAACLFAEIYTFNRCKMGLHGLGFRRCIIGRFG